MLPSPLTFQTPVNATGPSFRDGDSSGNRGSSRERDGSGERDAGVKRKVDEIATPIVNTAAAEKKEGSSEKLAVETGKRIKT